MREEPKFTATIIFRGQNMAGFEIATADTALEIRRQIFQECYAHLMHIIVGFGNKPIRLELELHEDELHESTFINNVTPLKAARTLGGLIDTVFKLLESKKSQAIV